MSLRIILMVALALSLGRLAIQTSQTCAQTIRKVPLFFHVASSEDAPAASDRFISEQLAHANAIYNQLGIALVDAGHAALPRRHAALVSRADRDALAQYLRPGVVNCMLVASLMDVDEPLRERRGVHWRARKTPARHFVIVSKISGPYVLAHELGHFFGNQAHSDATGNLMSYQHTSAVPFLAPFQIARVHETLGQMLARRELRLSQR